MGLDKATLLYPSKQLPSPQSQINILNSITSCEHAVCQGPIWTSTESCTCFFFLFPFFDTVNSTCVCEPNLNNYKSRGFNQGPAVWSNACVCFFYVCVHRWGPRIKVNQNITQEQLWQHLKLSLKTTNTYTDTHTQERTNRIFRRRRQAHTHPCLDLGFECFEKRCQHAVIRAEPSASLLQIAWMCERRWAVNGLAQCAIVF